MDHNVQLVGILYNTDIAKLEQLDQFILLLRRVCRAEFPAKWPDMVNWMASNFEVTARCVAHRHC